MVEITPTELVITKSYEGGVNVDGVLRFEVPSVGVGSDGTGLAVKVKAAHQSGAIKVTEHGKPVSWCITVHDPNTNHHTYQLPELAVVQLLFSGFKLFETGGRFDIRFPPGAGFMVKTLTVNTPIHRYTWTWPKVIPMEHSVTLIAFEPVSNTKTQYLAFEPCTKLFVGTYAELQPAFGVYPTVKLQHGSDLWNVSEVVGEDHKRMTWHVVSSVTQHSLTWHDGKPESSVDPQPEFIKIFPAPV